MTTNKPDPAPCAQCGKSTTYRGRTGIPWCSADCANKSGPLSDIIIGPATVMECRSWAEKARLLEADNAQLNFALATECQAYIKLRDERDKYKKALEQLIEDDCSNHAGYCFDRCTIIAKKALYFET